MKDRTIWLKLAAPCLAIAMVVQLGCGGGADDIVIDRDDSSDPLAYATDIKSDAIGILNGADDGPDAAADLTELLEDLDWAPVGSYGEIYRSLLSGAGELESMEANSAEFDAKVAELLTLAKSLPGEITPEDDDDENGDE